MHDEVKTVQIECIDSRRAEATETRPRVVEVVRAVGEAKAGKIERHPAQSTRAQLGQDLPVQKTRGWHPVKADDRVAFALLTHEAAHSGRLELASGRAMRLDNFSTRHLRETNQG